MEVPGRPALIFNVAGRHAGAALAADATEFDEDDAPPPLADEPQPASASTAVAVSAAPMDVARLARVLIRLLRLASSGVGLARFACARAAAVETPPCP
jgi:hypothetical protein